MVMKNLPRNLSQLEADKYFENNRFLLRDYSKRKAINDELNLLTDELTFVNYSHLLILFWNKSKLYVSQVKTAVSNNKHHQRVTCFCNPLWCSTFRRRKTTQPIPAVGRQKTEYASDALFQKRCYRHIINVFLNEEFQTRASKSEIDTCYNRINHILKFLVLHPVQQNDILQPSYKCRNSRTFVQHT